tara:strand:+ start:487 stop:768 length:282 start_codon:yes stop_codon:yes gene_type:complete
MEQLRDLLVTTAIARVFAVMDPAKDGGLFLHLLEILKGVLKEVAVPIMVNVLKSIGAHRRFVEVTLVARYNLFVLRHYFLSDTFLHVQGIFAS